MAEMTRPHVQTAARERHHLAGLDMQPLAEQIGQSPGPFGADVIRFERRTSLSVNAEQSVGPDRNLWAMFTMTR